MANGFNLPFAGNLPPNSNIKRVTLDLFDDNLTQSALTGAPIQAPNIDITTKGIPGGPNIGKAPAQAQQQQQQPGFTESPAFPLLLGQLAQAFTATSPRSPQFQIGNLVAQMSQNQIFNKLLKQLLQSALGGTQANPNIAAASLPSFEAAALNPDLQRAAFNTALQARGQTSDIIAQEFNNLLNSVQAANLADITAKRPTLAEETEAQKDIIKLKASLETPSTNTILLSKLADGREAPEGKLFRVSPNKQTGKFDIIQGIVDKPRVGGGADPAVQSRLWFNIFDKLAKTAVQRAGFGELVVQPDGSTAFKFTNPKEGSKLYRTEFRKNLREGAKQGLVPESFINFVRDDPDLGKKALDTTVSSNDVGFIDAITSNTAGKKLSDRLSKKLLEAFPSLKSFISEKERKRLFPPESAQQEPKVNEIPMLKSREDFNKLSIGDKFRLEDGRIGVKRSAETFDLLEK